MPAIIHQFTKRSGSSSLNPIYIAGFCVIGAIILCVAVWYGIRLYRKRVANRREEKQGAAFLSVRGIVREEDSEQKNPEPASMPAYSGNGFSRGQMDATIVLPDKAITRQSATREEVVNFHRQSGTLPLPFAPKPFSFALSANSSPRASMAESGSPSDRSSMFRNSFLSVASGSKRFSVMSSVSSVNSNPTTGTIRKVRQLFNPVLPDELLLINLGEQLTVVQSFDDGWCVVGRENASMVHTAKSLFKSTPVAEDNIELGVVPAWCFLKPVKGLRAERPVRNTSLGITVQMEAPGFSSRNDLVSWSNF